MEPSMIEYIRIRGFRSLADVELEGLPRATVLIGANGSGKSNFIRFFEMLSWMLRSRRLTEFVEMQGGADDQLHGGNHLTPHIEAEIRLRTEAGRNDYRFTLSRAHPDRFYFSEECFRFFPNALQTQIFEQSNLWEEAWWEHLGKGHQEAEIVKAAQSNEYPGVNIATAKVIVNLLRSCSVYQFHDTSKTSAFKKRWDAEDNNYLRSYGGNLAAVLLRLEREDIKRYELICQHISRVLPVFDRFQIEESYGRVSLRWKAKGSDKSFGAHLTSDGSLRFFALVTLLNLPPEMLPDVILLDEPELGLHPAAIALVAGMIKALAKDRQVIMATQSPLMVDAFGLEEIFVLDLKDGRTEFRNLSPDDYEAWLNDNFTPGELWQKNLLGGRP